MDNLVRILGPAPSELTVDEFIFHRLKKERERAEKSLLLFRSGVKPTWKKGKKKTAAKKRGPSKAAIAKKKATELQELQEALAAKGLTMADLKGALGKDN